MSASPEDLAQFTSITGASVEQAHFYLESAGGNVEAAVSTFFESGGAAGATSAAGAGAGADDDDMLDEDDDEQAYQAAPTPAFAAPTPAAPAPTASWGGGHTLSGASVPSSGPSSNSSSRSGTPSFGFRNTAPARAVTLGDLASRGAAPAPRGGVGRIHNSNDDSEDDDDDGKDPLEFFAGGEKSGMAVMNPNAGKKDAMGDYVKGILQKAVEGGQRVAGAVGAAGPSAGPSRSAFTGSAHTLGSDDTPSSFIPDPTARPAAGAGTRLPGGFPGAGASTDDDEMESEEVAVRNLTFWQDGFSIEDGDLMRYEEHQETLAALNSGRAPLALLKVKHDQQVELRIAKRLDEKWTRQPKPPAGPFAGEGNRLGSEMGPAVVTAPSAPAASSSSTSRGVPESAQPLFEVNQSQPVTSLQIRLRDGERMVARFNHTHTVADIRNYINHAHPGQSTNYVLQTTFPSKDLTDDSITIKDAGLLGSVIVQRGL
ncbi:ubx domain containing protein [Pseudohyphozyma bogoriensis]|nr:ubx domain containing protein [Pseudohyphozyma bogoriensis]